MEITLVQMLDARERRVARLACQALLYEVAVTPKPGLVDRANPHGGGRPV